jgi:selenocysteine-specific elongation factor
VTIVVGTAGHIDHGKTALLRALTGIDADRLPEERRRGMTIDVGYAHFVLPDGDTLDFVDVPGHDRLVGNMLVGAGEIDAVLLVVAADDGPRAQTLEHLELLDALGLRHGIAVVTKIDLVDGGRVAEVSAAVAELLGATTLAGSPVLAASSVDGQGLDAVRAALVDLCDRAAPARRDATGVGPGPSRLAIDRAFTVKGRGMVVTGTLRGGPLARNAPLRLVPGEARLRARELQVHGRAVEQAGPGRTAVNVAGPVTPWLRRGAVLTDDRAVAATDRLLVRFEGGRLADRARVRVHLGTAATDGAIGRAGRDAIDFTDGAGATILRLAEPIAAAPGDRLVLRRASGADRVIGGVVLDVSPPRGISRRRQSPARVGRLAEAILAGDTAAARARLDLHGALATASGATELAPDVRAAIETTVLSMFAPEAAEPASPPVQPALSAVRADAARALRRLVTLRREPAAAAAAELVDKLVADARLVRDGEQLRLPGAAPAEPVTDPALARAMERLEQALAVVAPPALAEAARAAGCPATGIRQLERIGRIVIVDRDLAFAATVYERLEAQALDLAAHAPLTPATLRDATGTSRKYVMAILADLDRRGILRRTEAGHVHGPRAGLVATTSGRR